MTETTFHCVQSSAPVLCARMMTTGLPNYPSMSWLVTASLWYPCVQHQCLRPIQPEYQSPPSSAGPSWKWTLRTFSGEWPPSCVDWCPGDALQFHRRMGGCDRTYDKWLSTECPCRLCILSWWAPYSASIFAYSLMDLKSSEALRSEHIMKIMNLCRKSRHEFKFRWGNLGQKWRSVCQQVCNVCSKPISSETVQPVEKRCDSSRCFLSENVFRTMQLYGCLGIGFINWVA